MNAEQLIETFNPANAKNLSPEHIAYLQQLTDEELAVLANAYPNKATNNSYLILTDSKLPADKQLAPRSTFQNLYNLRAGNKLKNFSASGFVVNQGTQNTAKPVSASVQDITGRDVLSLPGIGASQTQTGSITEPGNVQNNIETSATTSGATDGEDDKQEKEFTAFLLGDQTTKGQTENNITPEGEASNQGDNGREESEEEKQLREAEENFNKGLESEAGANQGNEGSADTIMPPLTDPKPEEGNTDTLTDINPAMAPDAPAPGTDPSRQNNTPNQNKGKAAAKKVTGN